MAGADALAHGMRMHGPVAEVVMHGCKAGLLYSWQFQGWKREWRIEAEGYKLDPLIFKYGEKGLQVVLTIGPQELRLRGHIWTEFIADGKRHSAIVVKGGDITWHDQPAAPARTRTQTAT